MTTMVVKILNRTKDIVQKGWTQNNFARNKYGHAVDHKSENASKFCLTGAFEQASNDESYIDKRQARDCLERAIANRTGHTDTEDDYTPMITFNDKKGRKKCEVVGIVEYAIQLAKDSAA